MLKHIDKKSVLGLRECHRSEIKIRRTRTRDSRGSAKPLETNDLCFLYILSGFKMTHFELQNEPFFASERPILLAKTAHFELQNEPF